MRKFYIGVFLSVILGRVQLISFLTPVVNTASGKVQGFRGLSGQNKFLSIPYAVSERFKAPRDVDPWDGVYHAVRWHNVCLQSLASFIHGSEDCLTLDVYTPEHATLGHTLPVVVFIHGGAYYFGGKDGFDPEFLVSKNVITVMINYRLGVFGFLCLNDVANLGLKDQRAALKWIQKNISAFGGDPDNVTLFGQSAGASSAAMHMLSESSKGLFHKLILMSGNPLTPWAFNLEAARPAFKDAKKHSRMTNAKEVYNYFANAPPYELMSVTKETGLDTRYFKYSPCVDSNFSDPFFRDSPYNIIKTGNFHKVPIIIGSTNAEGMPFYEVNNAQTLREIDKNFVEQLPSVFSWCSKKDKKKIAQMIRDNFFGTKGIARSSTQSGIDFYSVWLVNSTIGEFTDLIVKYSAQPVYRYVFSYEGGRDFFKAILGSGVTVKGVEHGDDLFYIFKQSGTSLVLSNEDKLFIDRLTTMYTNFMKFGDPTPSTSELLPIRWPPVTAAAPVAMHLDRRLSLFRPAKTRLEEFYLSLLCTYGQEGYVPCDSQKQCNLD